jgi:virulence factor
MAPGSAPLKIGVIGLGDIAQKGYLPVLTAQPGLELHLHTRTPATLARIGDAHRLPHRHTSLDALLDQGLDAAFVHAPTDPHLAIGSRLIEAGVPASVDKPSATTWPPPGSWWNSPTNAGSV